MMKVRAYARWLVAGFSVLALSGVAAGSAGASTAGKAKGGGTYTLLEATEVAGLDPALTNVVGFSSGAKLTAIYDSLLVQNTATGEIQPRLAESIKTTDAKTFTMKLKADVKFSDGTPFNAEAVKFNWERLKDPATQAVGRATAALITTIEVVDELTLRFTLSSANSLFPNLIAAQGLSWIGSPTAIKAKGNAAFALSPVGAGPYVIKEYVRNSTLTLTRNPNYWGDTWWDTVVIKVIPDEGQRLSTLQSGGGDALSTVDLNTRQPAIDAGMKVYPGINMGGLALIFNMGKAPFNDLRARQALSYAMDSKKVNQTLSNGLGTVAESFFTPASPYYSAKGKQPKPSRAKAQKLLDELAAEGKALNFTITSIPLYQRYAEWFITELASYKNITVKPLNIVAQNQVIPQFFVPGNYEMGMLAYGLLDPSQLREQFHSNGARDYTHWNNTEVDALIEKGETSVGQAAREAAYDDFQELLVRDMPISVYQRGANAYIFNPKTVTISGGNTKAMFSVSNLPLWDKVRPASKK